MSVQFTRERIRLLFDVESVNSVNDSVTADVAEMWRNNDVQFELAFQFGGELLDMSKYASIKLILKAAGDVRGPKLIEKVIAAADFNLTLTMEQWLDNSAQHVLVDATAAETQLDMKGEDSRAFILHVVATTTDDPARRVTLGFATLTMWDDGDDENVSIPALGASLIPLSAVYSGAGSYTLGGLTEGRIYSWAKSTNDTNLTNGTEVLTSTGNFTAAGTSVTLTGTVSALITAIIRTPVVLTADETDARYQRRQAPFAVSPSGRWVRVFGVDDEGQRYDQVIDTTA